MEAYKFLLESIEVDVSADYKPYVKTELLEIVSGESAKLKITIKNVSGETFPGGSIERWRILIYGADISPLQIVRELTEEELASLKIPKLSPGAAHQIEYTLLPTIPGIVEVSFKIASEDGKPVLHLKYLREEGADEFKFLLYALNRETLKILSLLNKIVKIVEKLPSE
jgi:hypothetical protein